MASRKILLMALGFSLGFASIAAAENPFNDVTKGHWAYDAVAELAAAGIIEGYGDASFAGERLLTRYEMAQLIARAMAKGAPVEKLAAEFREELNQLGVRVAALEERSDNLKVSGYIKSRNWSYHGTHRDYRGTNHRHEIRTDLRFTGRINDNWSYVGIVRNEQKLTGKDSSGNSYKNAGEEDSKFIEASIRGRIGGVKVVAGRIYVNMESGDIFEDRLDGIRVDYGKKYRFRGGYGLLSDYYYGYKAYSYNMEKQKYSMLKAGGDDGAKWAYGRFDAKVGTIGTHIGYYHFDSMSPLNTESNILALGANIPLSKQLELVGTYYRTNADHYVLKVTKLTPTATYGDQNPAPYSLNQRVRNDGFTMSLKYRKADAQKAGSYGLQLQYLDMPAGAILYHTSNTDMPSSLYGNSLDGKVAEPDGFRGWRCVGSWAVARNILFTTEYCSFKGATHDRHYDSIYTELRFNF